MKTHTYTSIVLLFISFNTIAQSPIIDLEDIPDFTKTVENTYYKDINNYMNPYEGTWVYTNGTTSFKIVLIKKEK